MQPNKFFYNNIKSVKLNFIKYVIRFVILQFIVTSLTIWYFDNFLVFSKEDKYQLYLNLLSDRDRFLPFIPTTIIAIDAILALIVFLFLVVLYSTKFYTYVNELDFSYEKSYLDEFFNIYLLWNSFLFSAFLIFRFSGLSRGNLLLFTFVVPIILLFFRNSEVLASLLGRSIINENFISFNLDEESQYRNLRIMSFRKNIGDYSIDDLEQIIEKVDSKNKTQNINLVVINMQNEQKLSKNLEKYLININKKVLLIANNQIEFKTQFLYRSENIENKFFVYFNNDIQYGAKFILKRMFDIVLSTFALILLIPLAAAIYIFIAIKNGRPVLIKQNRVGLHGKIFQMYKFRTMKINSHELRNELQELNEKTGPLFKLDEDPRLIHGAKFLRKYSLDEIPQIINVFKGEMSLVGPRPLFDTDTEMFNTEYMRRLNVIPGMTGLLQINERNADDFETWFKYDFEYIENWSLYLDIKIILKTIPSMFKRSIQGK